MYMTQFCRSVGSMGAEAGASPQIKVLVLGPTSSGKSTIVEQLRELARTDGASRRIGRTINVSPTQGQEVETLIFTSKYCWAPSEPAMQSETVVGDSSLPGLVRAVNPGPPKKRAVDTTAMTLADPIDVTVLMKEVGGSMMANWPKDTSSGWGTHLIYVVDASAPWTLPTAAVELFALLSEHGCGTWKVLVLINKLDLPATLPAQDVAQLLCIPQLQDIHREIDLACFPVDSWSGDQLDDVVRWLMRSARGGRAAPRIAPHYHR